MSYDDARGPGLFSPRYVVPITNQESAIPDGRCNRPGASADS